MPSRLPTSRKQVTATQRADRSKPLQSHGRIARTPTAPGRLSTLAVGEWKALAPLLTKAKTLSGSDLRALELLCETLASASEFAAIVRKEGATVPAAGGGTKGHPALQALATARSQARALLTDFGLTPRGRSGVDLAPDAEKQDPAEKFFK
jgi:P27 family predicted phage terminase small subunit